MKKIQSIQQHWNGRWKILMVFILLTSSFNVYAQNQIAITGVVADAQNEPIIGANVREKGNTTNGTITDIDGRFKLSVAQNAQLEVSYIGFVTQTVTVNANHLNISMREDSQILDEVVITGFGFAQKKATLTGAISTIGAEDIARSNAPTASGALVGKIPGLNTRQTDGRPGGGTQIRIRNMGAPLYVIDGIQVDEGQFNNIDFNDIENISVLKDASASIYGVRAANGVVVVTTKKGKRNTKNTVSINGYYGWQDNFKFAEPADAKTYVKKYVQSETMKIALGQMSEDNRLYSREEYDKWMAGTAPGYQSFDWYDYIWNSAPQSYINANISGGSDKINYYVSIGHLTQDATVRAYGGFERTNVQMNLDAQINDRLKVGAGINGRIETRENAAVPGNDDYWLPRFAVLRNVPTLGPYANGNPEYPQELDDKQTNFAVLNYEKSGPLKEDWRVVQLNADAEYEIIKGLKAKALVSYYFANKTFNNQEYTYELFKYDPNSQEYYSSYQMNTPYRERIHENVEEMTSNIQLAYDNKFGVHSISAVAGLEAIKRTRPHTRIVSTPTANSMNGIKFDEIKEFSESLDNPEARMGWVGRINYNFAEKYLLELSGRYDGSWKFPPDKRWGFFPSASAGWRVSEESFWKESKVNSFFNDLKLRVSYGMVGNDDLGDDYRAFGFLPGYNFGEGGTAIDGGYVTGSKPRGIPVTTVSWLEATIFDIGFEAGFFDNRLRTQFSYFNRKLDGLTEVRFDVVLPNEVGFTAPRENLNSNVTRGWDGMVMWTDRINDFRYNIGANATYSRFYDWDRYDDRRSNSWDQYRNSIAKRYGYLNWGLEAIGQFQSWEEIAAYPIDNDRQGNRTIIPGDVKYKDINGDGVINGMDERPIGYRQDSTPIFNYGINLGAAWKGFDFAADFTGSFMHTYFQEHEQARAFQNNGNSPQWLLDDSWSLSDPWDANSQMIPGKYPMAIRDRPGDNTFWNSTFWKHNVRYLKLRNLEIGYTLPKSLLSKVQIGSLRVYVSGTNLFALTNVQGVDPEQQDTNGLGYPTMRVVNFGFNLKF